MKWSTVLTIIQATLLLPIVLVVAYIGFWFSIVIGPLAIGVIIISLIYMAIQEYRGNIP